MLTVFDSDSDLAELLVEAQEAAESYIDGDPSHHVARMAGMALELARISDDVLDVLEVLKEALRKAAEPKLAENPDKVVRLQGESEFGTVLGHVAVTFPEDSVKLRKTADMARLKRTLGDRFGDFFEEKTSYKPKDDFKDRTTAAMRTAADHPEEAAEARVALAAVEVKESTPRVGFKPDSQFRR
jgi:hypothetical protein